MSGESSFMLVLSLVCLAIGVYFIQLIVAGRYKYATYKRCVLQTDNETEFFHRLIVALPEFHVLAQVSMAALIEPNVPKLNKKAWWQAFVAIAQQRVDYVVADHDMNVLVVIELDDRSHANKKRQDKLRDARLQGAGIPSLRYESTRKPDSSQLREVVLGVARRPRP